MSARPFSSSTEHRRNEQSTENAIRGGHRRRPAPFLRCQSSKEGRAPYNKDHLFSHIPLW